MSQKNDKELIDLTQADTESLTPTQSGSLVLSLTPHSQDNEPIDPYGRLNVYEILPKRLGFRLVDHILKEKINSIGKINAKKCSNGKLPLNLIFIRISSII